VSDSEAFARRASELAWAKLRSARRRAATRLEHAFRRNITAFGWDAQRVLERLGVPHRAYVSADWLPNGVVVLAPASWDKDLPSAGVVGDLLDRGGTAILGGDALRELDGRERVVRVAAPFDPAKDPRAEAAPFDEEALEAWAQRLVDLAEHIANAL
jgi:hypothetical protein